jgi:hypothetical protein
MKDMSSLEIINSIISNDDYLMKLAVIVEWLRTTKEQNENQITNSIEDLSNYDLKFTLSGDHLDDPNMKKLYSLLIKIIKSQGLSEGRELLKLIFGEKNLLGNILEGGLPFMDINTYEKVNDTEKGRKEIKKFRILDYMENGQIENLRNPYSKNSENSQMGRNSSNSTGDDDCLGNHRWLLWQFTLYRGMQKSKYDEEKKLFGHLCSEYENACLVENNQDEEFGFEDDAIFELFRVFLKSNV